MIIAVAKARAETAASSAAASTGHMRSVRRPPASSADAGGRFRVERRIGHRHGRRMAARGRARHGALGVAAAKPREARMILVIDNYDSFTYNLVHYLNELGAETLVRRNDALERATRRWALKPRGRAAVARAPARPTRRASAWTCSAAAPADLPILGVCLGHQAIGQAFGGEVVRAKALMHGKTSQIHHNGKGVFAGLKNPFTATRYHSLSVREGRPAGGPGGHRLDRRRRDHGRAAQDPAGPRRAVPPGIHRHRMRPRAAGQLPRPRRREAPGATA